ncbi:MAG: DUF1579 domain-containing protein [Planctomycetota bacterium]
MTSLDSFVLRATLVVFASGGLARAQETTPAPGTSPSIHESHAWLERFAGKWTTSSESNMGPDQPPMECTGTMESKMLGSLWVTNRMDGKMDQGSFQAIQTIGFDPEKKRFVGTWTDTMMPYLWVYEGTLDSTGNRLTLETEGPDYTGGAGTKFYRDSYEFLSDDRIISKSEIKDDGGNWNVMMKGTLIRVKTED